MKPSLKQTDLREWRKKLVRLVVCFGIFPRTLRFSSRASHLITISIEKCSMLAVWQTNPEWLSTDEDMQNKPAFDFATATTNG
jgi:hypothetical protein